MQETATCIGLSAVKLLKKDKDATLVVLPSDHYIEDEKAFRDTILQGVEVAERKRGLVTIGVLPTRPETGYGYVEMGERVIGEIPTFKVERFMEKPNIEVAKDFILKYLRYFAYCHNFLLYQNFIKITIDLDYSLSTMLKL